MGVVYEAEQDSPRRRVAVKVVRGGRVVDELSTRMFQREADVLARLQHPNIGAIYESGCTEDGRCFFAMELVRGLTLDAYLAARGPVESDDEVRFRLMLFRRITDAVHYAHQRGVIHRDLKPSNIIVSDDPLTAATRSGELSDPSGRLLPEVKVLDFGLARITEGDLGMTLATEVGVIKGTLSYMAPEQARGAPDEIDVRTDVYALGVVLYEMLSGRRPYDVMRTALVEALRVICEVPPAPLRETMGRSCRLDRDVETIVGKALEKEVERRYASAAALSQDIARYLTSLPILARPPSAAYQLRKFSARNRALVGGIVATFVTLVVGVVVATLLGVREAAERREAERARRDLEAVAEFQSEMLAGVDAEQVGRRLIVDLRGRVGDVRRARGDPAHEVEAAEEAFDTAIAGVNSTNVALRLIDEEILSRAAIAIVDQFGDQPLIEARLRDSIGETYGALGLDDRAQPHLESARELRRGVLGDDDPATLTSMAHLAALYWHQGKYDAALPLAERTLAVRTRVLGDSHRGTLASANTLAMVYASLGRLGDAERLYSATLEVQRNVLGARDPDTLLTMNNLGLLYKDQSRLGAARRQFEETLELSRAVLGAEDSATLATMNNLATTYAMDSLYPQAERQYLELIEIENRVLGEEHPNTLAAMNNLGLVYTSQGRLEEAESLILRTLTVRRRVLGAEHPGTLSSMNNLSNLYVEWGRLDRAEELDREVLAVRLRVLGAEHPDTLVSMNNLGVLYLNLGRYAEAERLLVEALETRLRVTGFAIRETDRVRRNLIRLYRAQGRTDQLRPLAADMLETARLLTEREDALASELNEYAWQLLTVEPAELRDPARALEVAQRACAKEEAGGGEELWNLLDTLALAWAETGNTAAAAETERRALALLPEGRPERESLQRQLEEFESRLERGDSVAAEGDRAGS
jgi:tetratricopeptide (TPR) repeat protein/tRNA A-37 threonylcarbamoyl transferase component Bud32